ncbi:MAG: TGS domain-containing protein [Fervidicoccaceae archaeon]|nr:MAG: GTP-binding protein [Fervidicoccus sp.]
MPTNLPPEAKAKWLKFTEARTLEEKIAALEEFISSVPKHKGTENLMYWATRRLSQLKEELEEQKKKKGGGSGPKFYIEKSGAAQVVLIGPPLSGKTMIFSKLIGIPYEGIGIPYSTRLPKPGMLKFEDIYFQLIDTPSIPFGSNERISWYNRTIGLARNSDMVLIVLDSISSPEGLAKIIIKEFEENGIFLRKPRGKVELLRESRGGINVVVNGKIIDGSIEDVKKMLKEYRIEHAIVKIWGEVSIDDIESQLLGNRIYRPAIFLVNKIDLADVKKLRDKMAEIEKISPVLYVSAKTSEGLNDIGRKIFESLEIIRVYTKQPNSDVAERPLILKKGATVKDVAEAVHSKMLRGFRYAKIYGKSVNYPGEKVGLDHKLEDGDVVEIYSKG